MQLSVQGWRGCSHGGKEFWKKGACEEAGELKEAVM